MHRVVISGLGAVAPLGHDSQSFWQQIKDGQSGIADISPLATDELKVSVGAEVKDFDAKEVLGNKASKRMDRFSQFGVAASLEAVKHSGYDIDANASRVGVLVGSGIGGMDHIYKNVTKANAKGFNRINPLFIPMIIGNMAGANIAIATGAKGVNLDIVTACASATNAIGEAFLKIRTGLLDAALAGGTEAALTKFGLATFEVLTALSINPDPATASRPFDKDRDGFVMGEGAGVVFLERLESALERQAPIIAEVVGYGTNNDAYHMTQPKEDGSGAGQAMVLAMDQAGIAPQAIDYINAHGTSTPANDTAETTAVKYAFGDHAYEIAMSSTKGATGHLLGAAGGIEAIITAKALEEGFIPPTLGLSQADEGCDLDYVPGQGRQADLTYAMSNSLGFGGHNASLIFKKWKGQ